MIRLLVLLVLLWPLQPLDDAARAAVQGTRRPMTEPLMRGASELGKPAVVLGALVVIACFTGPAGPATAREVLATLVATNVVVETVKRTTFRPRPDGEHKRSNAAFPSSHTANAFALAWALGRRWRRLLPAALLAAGVIAYSRMYLDRHWLSDVVVGVLVGLAVAWLVGRFFSARAALPRESPRG